jgi:hypothetical protein
MTVHPIARGTRALALAATGALIAACGSDQDSPLAPDVELPAIEAQAPLDLSPMSAPYTVDQANTRATRKFSEAIFANPSVGQIVRQTVTQGRTGLLGYLELPVICTPGTLLNVRITDARGTRILYEANAALTSSSTAEVSTIQLFDPAVSAGISLIRGQVWAFELRAFPTSGGASGGTCGIAREAIPNSYPRGSLFTQEGAGVTTWLARPADLVFRTLVR